MFDQVQLWAIVVPLGAYLLGSILPAEILARRQGLDLRQAGKNPGAGEAGRLWGLHVGILVFIFDALKGVVPLIAGWLIGVPPWSLALTAAMAIAGHNWSIYYGFWGGQGLSTAAGVYLYLLPQAFLVALVPSLFAWWKTKWIPINGIVGLPIISLLVWLNPDPVRRAAVVLISIVMLVRQREWIKQRLAVIRARRRSSVRPDAGAEAP
ncbi:MAG TPA: glycerol-3-phosphate acyltransferase [bacterium]|nr:glycerol-3-phosphate acyltransferase [bacterium]